jgi:hypothetical protein
MPVRVINIRSGHHRDDSPPPFIYVGRGMPAWGLPHHPLANPYRVAHDASEAKRREVLAKYEAWLASHTNRDALLRDLADQVAATGLPLACWCCDYDGVSEPSPLCHAVVLARQVGRILEER